MWANDWETNAETLNLWAAGLLDTWGYDLVGEIWRRALEMSKELEK